MISSLFFGFLIFGPIIGLIILIFAYFSLPPQERNRYSRDLVNAFIVFFISIYPSGLILLYIFDLCQFIHGVEGVHSFEGLLYYVLDKWGSLAAAVSIVFAVAFLSIGLGSGRRKRYFAYVSDKENFLTADGFVVRFFGLRRRAHVSFDVEGVTRVLKTLDMIVSGQKNYGFVRLYLNIRKMLSVGDREVVGKLRYGWRKVEDRYLRFLEVINLSIIPFVVAVGFLFIFVIGLFFEVLNLLVSGDIDVALFYFGLLARPKYPILWFVLVFMPLLLPVIYFFGGLYVFRLSKNDEVCKRLEDLIVKVASVVSKKISKPIRLSLLRVYSGFRLVERVRVRGRDILIVEIPTKGDSS